MPDYYIFDQDTQDVDLPVINDYPRDIDVADWIRGATVSRPPKVPIEIALSSSSGSRRPDLISYLLPLFSEKAKTGLENLGIDNIDYFPAALIDKSGGKAEGYYMGNVLGLVRAVDLPASQYREIKMGSKISFKLKSFCIDSKLVNGLRLFRIAESPRLVIVDEHTKQGIESLHLDGVRLLNTRSYDGY